MLADNTAADSNNLIQKPTLSNASCKTADNTAADSNNLIQTPTLSNVRW